MSAHLRVLTACNTAMHIHSHSHSQIDSASKSDSHIDSPKYNSRGIYV